MTSSIRNWLCLVHWFCKRHSLLNTEQESFYCHLIEKYFSNLKLNHCRLFSKLTIAPIAAEADPPPGADDLEPRL